MAVVRRQLERLGMETRELDLDGLNGSIDPADVLILDADAIPGDRRECMAWRIAAPIIALIGTETPSRLKPLLELEPASFLVKPLRTAGLYAAIVLAFDRAQKNADASKEVERLKERIRARQLVFAALLQIMRRRNLSESDAFSLVRRTAMTRRTTVEQLSAEIVALGDLPGSAARAG
jgi:AmiR/NasT family two-component response regulator